MPLLIAALFLSAPPDFIKHETAPQLVQLLAPGYSVLEQRPVDVDGDGKTERLVLVGGARGPVGIMVCKRGWRLIAAVRLASNPAWDFTLATDHPDLTGDGRPELAVHEAVSAPNLTLRATTWWHLADGALHRAHYLCRDATSRAGRETRTLEILPKGRLVERINAGGGVSGTFVNLIWSPGSKRFAPVRIRVVP